MYHCKDKSPESTISMIKEILINLNVQIDEQHTIELKQLYSVILRIKGTGIGVNGKGVTLELAYASAYGELMERMQNLFLYPAFPNYPDPSLLQDNAKFIVCPDEKSLSIEEVWKKMPKKARRALFQAENKWCQNNIADSKILMMQPHRNRLLCVPYYRCESMEVIDLPLSHVYLHYGTNGMCAGNTPEEALVQGISEIIERYVNFRVVSEEISLSDISREQLATHFSQSLESIRLIEASGQYEVTVKDCSLGMGLPVVAVILVDLRYSRYFLKFGAHPIISIALERALTEMFQGRKLARFNDFRDFQYSQSLEDTSSYQNMMSIFRNGAAFYPASVFNSPKPQYPRRSEHYSRVFKSNRECLAFLLDIISANNWDLYIRDCNYLGFPSYHLIIPSVSEVHTIQDCTYYRVGAFSKMSRKLRDIQSLSEGELGEVADFLKKSGAMNGVSTSLADLTNPFTSESFKWKKMSCILLYVLICYRLEDYKEAHLYLSKCLSLSNITNPRAARYYKCARDYIAAKMRNDSPNKTEHILRRIYG